MKKKLAALLRRWAYALHPETSATLPPGYDLKQVVSQYSYTLKDGKMPEAAVVESFRDAITDDHSKIRQRRYKLPRRHTPDTRRHGRLHRYAIRRH